MKKQLILLILLLGFPVTQAMVPKAASFEDRVADITDEIDETDDVRASAESSAVSAVPMITVRGAIDRIAANLGISGSDSRIGEVTRTVRLCAGDRTILDEEAVLGIEQQLRSQFGSQGQVSSVEQPAQYGERVAASDEDRKESLEDFDAEQASLMVARHAAIEEFNSAEAKRLKKERERARDNELIASFDVVSDAPVVASVMGRDDEKEGAEEEVDTESQKVVTEEEFYRAFGNLQAMEILLKRGVPRSMINRYFESVLYNAIRDFDRELPVLNLLWSYGADINASSKMDLARSGNTILLQFLDYGNYDYPSYPSAHFGEVVKFLVGVGARIDHRNRAQETGVHLALNPSRMRPETVTLMPETDIVAAQERLHFFKNFKQVMRVILSKADRQEELAFLEDHRFPGEEVVFQQGLREILKEVLCNDAANIVRSYAEGNPLWLLSSHMEQPSNAINFDDEDEQSSGRKSKCNGCAIL